MVSADKSIPGYGSSKFQRPSLLGDRAKVVIMGGVLGFILMVYFWPDRSPAPTKPVVVRPPTVDVSVFKPDPDILARIKDSTPLERGTGLDAEALFHLLKLSYNIGPAAAAGLGLAKRATDVQDLRESPNSYRGRFIWLKGRLEKFEQQKLHPIPRARSFKGRLRTAEGDQVVFWVSKDLPRGMKLEDQPWVRLEGFFVKIVDEHYINDKVTDAPLLIGPRLAEAYPDWEPVESLDKRILDPAANAIMRNGRWDIVEGTGLYLEDAQDKPLWHLASYARHQAKILGEQDLRHGEIFELKEQYTGFKTGRYERGAPLRLRGTFVQARVIRAEVNPIGVEFWTSAWIRVNRLGAKMLPIWIPKDIGDWKVGDSVDVDAFYFRNRGYESLDGSVVHTPQFVAADLTRYAPQSHPAKFWMGIGFALMVLMLTVVFFRMGRNARKESQEYKARMIERQRQRRAELPQDIGI